MALILPILAILISILTSLLMLVMLAPSGKPLAIGDSAGSLPSHALRETSSTRGWSIATVLIAAVGTIAAIWAISEDRMLLACALGIAPTISVALTFGYFLYREA